MGGTLDPETPRSCRPAMNAPPAHPSEHNWKKKVSPCAMLCAVVPKAVCVHRLMGAPEVMTNTTCTAKDVENKCGARTW